MQEGEVAGPRRRTPGLVCMLALALVLSGCGSGGGGPAPEPPVSPPPQPTGLTAEAGDGEVRLSWTAIAEATRWEYRQRIGDGNWGAWTTIPGSGSGTMDHTVTDLENGTAYGFQVRAVNAGGTGPASAEATATLVPPQPADLTAVAGDGLVELTWTAIATASGWEYRLRLGDGEWGPWTAVPGSGPETGGHTVADLEHGKAYRFQVRAVNAGGAGPASAEATATLVPPQPADLTATAGDGLVELAWTAVETATGWEYRLRTDDAEWGPWTTVPDGGPETAAHTVADLDNGKAYRFQVRAVNAGGAGSASAEATATPVPPVPPQPADLTATAGDGLVELAWTAIATASGWEYRLRTGDGEWGPWTTVPHSGPETTAHTVADLENGTAYGFQVRGVNAGGAGPASAEATATPVPPVPPQPADLTATAGDGLVELSWSAVETASGWEYRQRAGEGEWGPWTTVPDSGPETRAHTVADLENGTAYGFQIRAVNAGGAGPASAEATATPVAPGVPVEIPDANLRQVLELALDKVPGETITDVELRTLSELRAEGRGIVDLTGLEHATGLKWAYLEENLIVDLEALASLAALTGLELRSNRVADLAPLASLSSLTRLILGPNRVSDLVPLAGLTSLEHLDLSYNKVVDLSPLSSLASLTWLDLSGNRALADLNPLGGLTSLEHLDLTYNSVFELEPLSNLTSLTFLSLTINRIADISALRGLRSLEKLILGGNPVSDVEPLSGLTMLRYLHLGHLDAVESLRFLSELEELTHLYIDGTSAADLSPLAALNRLEVLDISETAVDDLSALAALNRLEFLDISETAVNDLSPLANTASLREIHMRGLLADLTPISELPSLRSIVQLGLTGGALPKVDISPLAGLTSLEYLSASPKYGDLSPLSGHAALLRLHLHEPGTPFENLAALEGLRLAQLTMTDGGLEDISPLGELASLRKLNIECNSIEDLEALAGLEWLGNVNVDDNRVYDIAALVANAALDDGATVSLVGNPLGPDALWTHIPELESRGVSVFYDRDDVPDSPLRVLHDEAVSMLVDVDLETARTRDLELAAYAEEFISHFGDEFDVLLFLSALGSTSDHADLPYYGVYHHVSNHVRGIGLDELKYPPDNATRLKGLIHFPWLDALGYGPSLHEIMHIWANHGVETSYGAHWGFSSADGQLGGFRLEDLVDLGGGLWSAGRFGTIANGGNRVPYSPWELYLGGFVGPDEVPDLWVAPGGRWTGERTENGLSIFEAAEHSTLTLDEFVETHGEREPDHVAAPKELRGAVIVLEDDDHKLRRWNGLLEQVRGLSHPGPHAAFGLRYNYHEATGGRGRLVLDGLRDLHRETPLARVPALRLIQVCPSPGAPSPIDAASPTAPWADGPSPADFGKGWDLRPGERTED